MVGKDAGKLFNHRSLARAAYGEVTHGDDLYAKRVITDDAGFVQPASAFDDNEENFGKAEEHSSEQGGLFAPALTEDDLKGEGFKLFLPGTEGLAHWSESARESGVLQVGE